MRGQSGAAEVTGFDTSPFSSRLGCEVQGIPSNPWPGPGRAASLAIEAGRQALAHAGLANTGLGETALVLGTTMGESCWLESWDVNAVCEGASAVPAEQLVGSGPDAVGRDIAAALGLRGGVTMLAGACAAGNYALGHALDLVRLGRTERVLAGGTDAFSRVAFTGFARLGALATEACCPFSAGRDGLVLGEGAALLLVESEEGARARAATPLAELAGIGLSGDAFHIVSPDPDGRGAARAMVAALSDAGVNRGEIDYLSAHGTGTPANDRSEVAAVRAIFGSDGHPPMSSIKALTGHGLGAASAIEAVACVLALREQVAPPTWNYRGKDAACDWDVVPNEPRPLQLDVVLSNAYAFGGCNASLVLRRVAE